MNFVEVGSYLFSNLTPGLGSKNFGYLTIQYSFQEQSCGNKCLFISLPSPNSRLGNTKQGGTNCAGISISATFQRVSTFCGTNPVPLSGSALRRVSRTDPFALYIAHCGRGNRPI
jgi:hypothetical protein